DRQARSSLPPSFSPSPLAEVAVLSDLWSPIEEVRRTIAQLSATGAHAHVIQIVDPAEESFPYAGRIEFIVPEGARTITAGRAKSGPRRRGCCSIYRRGRKPRHGRRAGSRRCACCSPVC